MEDSISRSLYRGTGRKADNGEHKKCKAYWLHTKSFSLTLRRTVGQQRSSELSRSLGGKLGSDHGSRSQITVPSVHESGSSVGRIGTTPSKLRSSSGNSDASKVTAPWTHFVFFNPASPIELSLYPRPDVEANRRAEGTSGRLDTAAPAAAVSAPCSFDDSPRSRSQKQHRGKKTTAPNQAPSTSSTARPLFSHPRQPLPSRLASHPPSPGHHCCAGAGAVAKRARHRP